MKRATLVVALALLAAACGDGGTVTTTAPPATAAPTTAAPTTTAAPATTTAAPTTTTVAPTTTTVAPTTTTEAAPAGIVAGEDPDVDAIVLAYTTALDSVTEFEGKAPFIEDPAGLEGTVTAYNATGEAFGGIGVLPTAVTIDGDTAVVMYDLLFGGNPSYPNQSGDAIKIDGEWKITREGFCALMTLARVGCP